MADRSVTVQHMPGHAVSYATTKIQVYFNQTILSTASGFVLKFAQKYYLVTNLHVVTGRSPITGICLSRRGGIPNRIECHVSLITPIRESKQTGFITFFKPLDIDLFYDEDMEKPIWYDAKTENNQADYCVIPLADYVPELNESGKFIRSIDGGKVTLKRDAKKKDKTHLDDINYFYPPVGHEVFVVGYPKGISPSGIFPIWKRASLASEPFVALVLDQYTSEEVILVDSLTKAGMSGSPVVCLMKDGDDYFTDDGVVVKGRRDRVLLVGVYAGREGVTNDEAELALGRVWKVEAIEILIASCGI